MKNWFCESLSSIEEKIELGKLREITRKRMNNTETLETELKEKEEQTEGESKTISRFKYWRKNSIRQIIENRNNTRETKNTKKNN